MKTLRILLLATAALLFVGCIVTGCAGTQADRQHTCESARAVYEAYQATLAIREPSRDEVIAAAAAGAFLRISCGWTTPQTRGQSDPFDGYGVLILTAP